MSTLIFAPLILPIQFIKYLFLAMNQTEAVAEMASLYMRIVAPGVITYYWAAAYLTFASS